MLRLILIYYRQGPHARAAVVQWSWWWETLTHCRFLIAGLNPDIVIFLTQLLLSLWLLWMHKITCKYFLRMFSLSHKALERGKVSI
jgi:hypothetical protein